MGEDKLELDFESNPTDIINSEHQMVDETSLRRPIASGPTPSYQKSLREYCSILFLRPRMKIFLRGQKVKTKLISKSLTSTEKDVYKPVWLEKPVKITLGFNQNKDEYGIMMYHNNRLIKAYMKVGCQKQNNELGTGVVGVVSVDFLTPIHNKQDFNKTDQYNTFMNGVGIKLNDYWNTKMGEETDPDVTISKRPDWTWVMCDNCLKWRRVPDCVNPEDLPEKWYCYDNTDPTHNRCDIKEEPEDEDELLLRATYQKRKKPINSKYKMKEEELRNREEYLAAKERIINSAQAPARAALEATRKSLLEAKQREQEHLEYIRMLKNREKIFLEKSHAESKKASTVEDDEDDEEEEEEAARRKSPGRAAARDSPRKRGPGEKLKVAMSFKKPVHHEHHAEEEEDDVMIVEVVNSGKKRRASEDIKPDVEELNKNMNKDKETPSKRKKTNPTEEGVMEITPIAPEVEPEAVPEPVQEVAQPGKGKGPGKRSRRSRSREDTATPPGQTGEGASRFSGVAGDSQRPLHRFNRRPPHSSYTQATSMSSMAPMNMAFASMPDMPMGMPPNMPDMAPGTSTADPMAVPNLAAMLSSIPRSVLPQATSIPHPAPVPAVSEAPVSSVPPATASTSTDGATASNTKRTSPEPSTTDAAQSSTAAAEPAPSLPPSTTTANKPTESSSAQSAPTTNSTTEPTPSTSSAAAPTTSDGAMPSMTSEIVLAEELKSYKAELQRTKQTLIDLRQNVFQLLEFIVPNQTLGSIEMVDAVVAEMLKVKKELQDDDTPTEKSGASEDNTITGESGTLGNKATTGGSGTLEKDNPENQTTANVTTETENADSSTAASERSDKETTECLPADKDK